MGKEGRYVKQKGRISDFLIKHNKEKSIPRVLLTESQHMFIFDAFKIQKKKKKKEALTAIPSVRLDETIGTQIPRNCPLRHINISCARFISGIHISSG